MTLVNFKTCVGLGDLIHIKQMLDLYSKTNKQISFNLSLDYDIIRAFRNEKYIPFIEEIFEKLFASNYSINKSSLGELINPVVLMNQYKMIPQIPHLENYFCVPTTKNEDVVILTKIRGMNINFFENIKHNFIEIIKQISKNRKIVLLGERQIGFNAEYNIIGKNNIYSIYDVLIEKLPNIIDKTVVELGITPPNYTTFINDCNIMNSAKNVITLSTGGNVSVAMSVSDVINYYGNSEMYSLFSKMEKNKNKYLTDNIDDYFEKLKQLV